MGYTPTQLVFRQFMRNFRDYGPGVALLKTIFRLCRSIYGVRVYVIYHIALGRSLRFSGIESELKYHLLDPNEEGLIEQIEDTEEWLNHRIRAQIRQGALCLVALDRERVIGFNLVSFGRVEIPLIETELVLNPHSAWSEQITVVREFRNRGIASELRYRVFNELRSRGVTDFYGGTLALNIVSRALAHKVGFQEILEVHYRKVLHSRTRRYVSLRSAPPLESMDLVIESSEFATRH